MVPGNSLKSEAALGPFPVDTSQGLPWLKQAHLVKWRWVNGKEVGKTKKKVNPVTVFVKGSRSFE